MHAHRQHVRPREHGRLRRRPLEQVLADMVRVALADRDGPGIVAIGGPGGTGKSSLSRRLAAALGPEAAVLALDDYKTPRSTRQEANLFGAHPLANRMDLIARHLEHVRNGQAFRRPVYDPLIGQAGATELFTPARYNLVDGEVATYAEFRQLVDLSIFIDSDWRTQLATRLGRDIRDRGYSPQKAIATFLHSNLREFAEHGAASRNWAHVHLFCHPDYRLELESLCSELYQQARHILHDQVEEVRIDGLIVPLLTPFDASGAIDARPFVEHLEWLAARGVRRVLVGGTTGEFFSLEPRERLELLQLALEYFPGLVLLQVGGQSLPEAIDLTRQAGQLGADAVLCLPPAYYADAPAEGLVSYFRAVAAASELPLILYNFPRHTQNPLTRDILSQVPHLGMKDSSADLSLVAATPRYFVGGDPLILEAHRAGAAGFVSGMANVDPQLYVRMERALAATDPSQAIACQQEILRAWQDAGEGHEIPLLKRLMTKALPGYPPHVRPPLQQP